MKKLDYDKLAFEFQTTNISLTEMAKREQVDRKYRLFEFFKNGSRSVEEFAELLSGNIGGASEMGNTEINSGIKESESSYSVEVETNIV